MNLRLAFFYSCYFWDRTLEFCHHIPSRVRQGCLFEGKIHLGSSIKELVYAV
jgi:hypothetical protein